MKKEKKELRKTKNGLIDMRFLNKNEKESYIETLNCVLKYVHISVAHQYIFCRYCEETKEYWFYEESSKCYSF